VSTSTYDSTERQATEALDQALIVRGGLLLPSGTLEIDNTTLTSAHRPNHVTVNGFALLPVLVVVTSPPSVCARTSCCRHSQRGWACRISFKWTFGLPYGYELIRSVDAIMIRRPRAAFGLGDISASVSRQITTEHGRNARYARECALPSRRGEGRLQSVTSSQVALGNGLQRTAGKFDTSEVE